MLSIHNKLGKELTKQQKNVEDKNKDFFKTKVKIKLDLKQSKILIVINVNEIIPSIK